ncbi:MAG: TIGR01212 family radical SAM protein [bacterium]|nr:MAG: TIGR01212 family radical SAM protein [bacterium]
MPEDRFYSLGRYFKKTFGERVHRLRINVGGVKTGSEAGTGGFITLNAGGTLADPAAGENPPPFSEQMRQSKERIRRRYKSGKFIVNLQSAPDAVIPLETMYSLVDELLHDNEVIGIIITTTPEFISDDATRFFRHTSEYILTWMELGIHSVHDDTLSRIGAGHTHEQTLKALKISLTMRLSVSPHIVLGLPGETADMMRQTMREITKMNIQGINIHHMYVLRDTLMDDLYGKGELKPPTRDEYVNLVCDFIELLPPEIVLQRIVGEVAETRLIAPDWTLERKETLTAITEEMQKRGSTQGCRWPESEPAIREVAG